MSPVCVILDRNVILPYAKECDIRRADSPFEVNVAGVISSSPFQFAININCNGQHLFHWNPRWSEGRTVMNTMGPHGWGQPEYSYYASLTPNSRFTVKIRYANGQFQVFLNNEKPTYFNARSCPSGTLRGVSIDKVDRKDVSISLVQLDIL